MSNKMRKILASLLALVIVAGCGFLASDARLRATDEEELPEVEAPAAEEQAAEQTEEPAEEKVEAEVVVEENTEYSVSEVVTVPADEVEEEAEETKEEAEETKEETEEEEETPAIDYSKLKYSFSSDHEGEMVEPGTVITLTAELEGFEGIDYKCFWQYTTDGKKYKTAGSGDSYSYEAAEENADWLWRLAVGVKQ